jgi:hypothetical protein
MDGSAAAATTTIDYSGLLTQITRANAGQAYSVIANAPFKNTVDMGLLFLGFIVVYIVDDKTNEIQLKATSRTEEYKLAVEKFDFKPTSYHLSFDKDKHNTIVQAIATGKPQTTCDWVTLNRGETAPEVVRINQANSGIACSIIYPLKSAVKGALMYNYYQYQEQIGSPQQSFMEHYTKLVSTYLESHPIQ